MGAREPVGVLEAAEAAALEAVGFEEWAAGGRGGAAVTLETSATLEAIGERESIGGGMRAGDAAEEARPVMSGDSALMFTTVGDDGGGS